jgi:hypothetical protein
MAITKKTVAKKPVVKKEKDWKKATLTDLKKYVDDKGLKITRSEDEEFTAESGSAEYRVFRSYNDAEREARRYVEEMINEMPDSFNLDFMQEHYYVTDTDRRLVAQNMADSAMENEGLEDGDEEYQEKYDKVYDEWYEGLGKDPIYFLIEEQGIYSSPSEISFLSIDEEEAAEAAVNEDGVAHFLSSYDGKEIKLVTSAVSYRTN